MRRLSDLWFRLRATFAPGKMEREMDEEMAFHLELETRKLIKRGMSPREAQREARRRFGDPMREKERARGAWGIGLVQDFRSDALQTLRSLRRNPVFATVAVLTLALGIGGTTAIFSVVNGVLLKPLPYLDPGGLVSVHHADRRGSRDPFPIGPALYFTFRDHARTLQDIGIYHEEAVTVTGLDTPERVDAMQVTDGLFPVLGIEPMIGRGYTAEDVSPGTAYPLILSYDYWQNRLGGDPDVLHRTLRVEGMELAIQGVLPPHARLPVLGTDIVLPLVFNRDRIGIGNFSFVGIARLSPGATPEQATRELAGLTEVADREYPSGLSLQELRARGFTSLVQPLRDYFVGGAGTAVWLVFGAVCLVLLIACANVANLFLVRAEARQRDVALRAALGASGGRLARQLLTESLLIGLVGGVFGLLLAAWGIHVLLSMAPSGIPRIETIGLNPVVLGFALGTSILTGLAFGSIPALRLRTSELVEPLKEGGRGSGGGVRHLRFRTVFAVFQVALALVLLVGSGLMVRSFQALLRVSPGFEDPKEVLTMRVAVPPTEEPDVDQATRIQQTIVERIAHLPGVVSVSGATSVAMEDWASWDDWMVEEFPLAEGEVAPERRINWMVPGYHATIRNRLLAGRSLEWDDIYQRRNVALITENFAREYWEEPARALGKRVRNNENGPWREIVGVVGNVHTRGVANEAPSVIYLPYITADFWGSEAFSFGELRYVIRTERPDPLSLVPEVRQTVWSVHPNLAISEVRTLDQIFYQSIARTSFTLVMLGIAALVALILGMVGVYGVISYLVAQRTREMGVRLAIGASQVQVRDLVLRQGIVFAVAGVTVGLAVAAGLTRLMGSLLFGVAPVDGTTYATVSVVLVAVVFLASYLPARRAARVDPVVALRAD